MTTSRLIASKDVYGPYTSTAVINVWDFLSDTQKADISSWGGLQNVTTAINNAIAALPATGGELYFPPGRYITNGNHSISVPVIFRGAGIGRNLDSTTSITQIEVVSNTACGVTIAAMRAVVKEIAFVMASGSAPTSTSVGVQFTGGGNLYTRNDIFDTTIDGFYTGIDHQAMGDNYISRNCIINWTHYGIKTKNVYNADVGAAYINENLIFSAGTSATAGIYALGPGGMTIDSNSIIPNDSHNIVDGIYVDFTGLTTQQMRIVNNDIDFCSNYVLNIVKGVADTYIEGNYFGCGHGTQTACIAADTIPFSTFGANTWKIGSQTSILTVTGSGSQYITVTPQSTQGLGASLPAGKNNVDLSQIQPRKNLIAGPIDPRLPGLTMAAVDTASNIHGTEFQVDAPVTLSAVELVIGTSSGNISVGILDKEANTWVATTGSVVCPAAGVRDINFTASVTLQPGKRYYAYWGADNTTATFLSAVQTYSPASFDSLNVYTTSYFPCPTVGTIGVPNGHTGTKAAVLCFF